MFQPSSAHDASVIIFVSMTKTKTPIKPAATTEKSVATKPSTTTHLLGWQGATIDIPENWNLAQFKGDSQKGQLRIDDEDAPRLEVRWETPTAAIDIEKSVYKLMTSLERSAKKRHEPFERQEKPLVVAKSRKRKDRVTNFGWIGDTSSLAAQSWGVSWQCPDCKRVVVAHILGRGDEKPERVRELAGRVLESLECHSEGGWDTWSVFDLRVEVPEAFRLERAKLVTGRLEFDWVRGDTGGQFGWARRNERLQLMRFSLASMLMHNEDLSQWTERVVKFSDKKFRWGKLEKSQVLGCDGLTARGAWKDVRKIAIHRIIDKLRKKALSPPQLLVWHDEKTNKIYVLKSDVQPENTHVINDILESL